MFAVLRIFLLLCFSFIFLTLINCSLNLMTGCDIFGIKKCNPGFDDESSTLFRRILGSLLFADLLSVALCLWDSDGESNCGTFCDRLSLA